MLLASVAGVSVYAAPTGAIIAAATVLWRKLTGQDRQLTEIHVLVNNQMTAALERIASLEKKLGLEPDEAIPSPQLVTPVTPKTDPP